MGNVPTTNLNAYYATTTPGTTIQSSPIDPALQDIVQTVNDNFALFSNFINPISGELLIPDQTIVTRHLRNLAVTNPKLAPLAVTADKIADGSITLTKLADLVVTAAKIANGTITEPKMADNSVSRRMIVPGAVGANEIDPTILDPISDATINIRLNQIDEQLADTATLTSSQFGITGDGSDETSKVANLIMSIPLKGAKVVFDKTKEVVINGTSLIAINGKENVVIEGLNVSGSSSAAFSITGGSKYITFRDCVFKDLNQIIYLFDCEYIFIVNCTFKNIGYGIIQRFGFASSNVCIVTNFITGAKKDFVEANCTATARSKNWIIAGNIYQEGFYYEAAKIAQGSGDYTTYRECRFAGITAVDHLIIERNIIEKVAGDSAVHLEDIGTSYQIINNIFDNILGNGYIFLLPTSATADDSESIISLNTFLRTDAEAGIGNVLNISANIFANEVIFTKNRVIGLSSFHNLTLSVNSQKNKIITDNAFRYCTTALSLISNSYADVRGNRFRDCDKAVFAPSLKFSKLSGNTAINCGYGFDLHDGVSTLNGGAEDCEIHQNTFIDMTGPCFISRRNGSGNLPPKRLDIQLNIFSVNPSGFSVRVGGNATTGATAAQDITFTNNTMKTGATVQINNGEKLIEGNNIYHDKVGIQPIVPKTSIAVAPEFLNEIAIVSGVAYMSTGITTTADWKQISN